MLRRKLLAGVAGLVELFPLLRSGDAGDDPGGSPPAKSEVRAETGKSASEYVAGLVRESGGRMRQGSVVEETGWSKATVSRLLTEMEAAGEVERMKVGREKVVCLPGYQVPERR